MSGLRFETRPPFRDLVGRFVKAYDEAILQGRRDMMRALGRRFLAYARDEAPKRSGRFADRLNYRTFVEGNGGVIGFRSLMVKPLGNYIVLGTKAHEITPKHKRALFWDGARHPVARVWHPGTKPNPFLGRAYRRWLPGARAELRRLGTRYQRTLASGTKAGAL